MHCPGQYDSKPCVSARDNKLSVGVFIEQTKQGLRGGGAAISFLHVRIAILQNVPDLLFLRIHCFLFDLERKKKSPLQQQQFRSTENKSCENVAIRRHIPPKRIGEYRVPDQSCPLSCAHWLCCIWTKVASNNHITEENQFLCRNSLITHHGWGCPNTIGKISGVYF